jgi:hybrid cluster-associated redox disulfide protein
MNNQLLGPRTTVAETLGQMPQASRIFMQYHTGCVGCFLARFCTLKEMADAYKIDLPLFLDALQCSTQPANDFEKGD